jgi:PIN domain nuclease of toxin-antitoxin system
VIVADTHAFVWLVAAPDRLSRRARAELDAADEIAVSAISCWEIAVLVQRGRLEFDREVGAWIRQALALPRINCVAVDSSIAVAAAQLTGSPADPADRIVLATARELGCALVSKDEELQRADLVPVVW